MIMIVVYIQYPLIMSISKRSRGFVVVVVVVVVVVAAVDVVFLFCLFAYFSISSLCNKHVYLVTL